MFLRSLNLIFWKFCQKSAVFCEKNHFFKEHGVYLAKTVITFDSQIFKSFPMRILHQVSPWYKVTRYTPETKWPKFTPTWKSIFAPFWIAKINYNQEKLSPLYRSRKNAIDAKITADKIHVNVC
jgi:hypothetical protein